MSYHITNALDNSFLSLGCSIQLPLHQSSDGDDVEKEVNHLRRIDQAVSRAQVDVVATVSKSSTLIEHKESKENLAGGILTVGTMVSNYVLCFPVVVARHQLQAFPTPYSFRRDTPLFCARRIRRIVKSQGAGVLYAGFGLGLIGQAATALYESAVSFVMSYLRPWLNQTIFYILSTGLEWGISLPLYPFYRTALILRVQSAGTHRIITSASDFVRIYRNDLSRFFIRRKNPTSLPLASLFAPSCALHVASEKMLMLFYKCIHRTFTKRIQRPRHHRRSRRQQFVEQQQQQILESSNPFSDIPARQSNNNKPFSPLNSSSSGGGRKEDTSMLRTFYPEIVSGMISSMITRSICYPLDSVLFKLMLQDTGIQPIQTDYRGFWDCVVRTYREEGGLRAFYPGWGGCVLEMVVSYLVLEGAWAAYRVIEWKLSKYPYKEPRSVRKARKLQERMEGR